MKLQIDLRIIFLIPLFLTIITPISSQTFHFHNNYCLDNVGNYTTGSTYEENIIGLLPNLVNKASLSLFNNQTIGRGMIDQTYGLYMCRGDLNVEQCHDCVDTATKTIVEKCPVQKEAIVWYQECMVRYANRPIFSQEEEGQMSYIWSVLNVAKPEEFGQIISETMDGIITQAAYNETRRGYAVDQVNLTLLENVYAFGQCTPDILGSRCERCLRAAFRNMGGCCGTARVSLEMYLPSCWLRYGQVPFIGEFSSNDTDTTTSPGGALSPTSSSISEPIPTFDFLPPNDTSVVPPQARSGGSQLTSMTNYLIAMMVLTVSFLCMAW